MILVTLGTQKQSFNRLLDMIEKSNINDKIIVQAGYTKYKSKKMKMLDFVDYQEMDKLIKQADLIITHGGVGSIISGLKNNKKIIACPRLKKYKEHTNMARHTLCDAQREDGQGDTGYSKRDG